MKIQGTSGISFAIPIDSARHVIDQLLKNRRVVRPYLGLQMADYYSGDEMKVGAGAASSQPVVLGVSPGSPAAAAGLQRYDTILELDGKKVSSVEDVISGVGLEVGRVLELKVQRRTGEVRKVRVATVADS
eukprot:gene2606-3150_t